MNLVFDALREVISGAEKRIPVVRETCAWCNGDGCRACNQKGTVLTERIDVQPVEEKQ